MPAIPGLNPAQVIILSLLFLGGGEALQGMRAVQYSPLFQVEKVML